MKNHSTSSEERVARPKRDCIQCGRMVCFKYRYNARRVVVRHKCPHGTWCVGSNVITQMHANHVSLKACPDCYRERKHL